MVPVVVNACCATVRVARLVPIRRIRWTRFTLSRFLITVSWIRSAGIRNRIAVSSAPALVPVVDKITRRSDPDDNSTHHNDGFAGSRAKADYSSNPLCDRYRNRASAPPTRISQIGGTVKGISVEVDPTSEPNRILGNESPAGRIE